MKESSKEQFQRFKQDNPHLQGQLKAVEDTVLSMVECYERGGKVLVCGNGGSAADSEHIVGELMKGFLKKDL